MLLVIKKILASPIFEDDLLLITTFIVLLAIILANIAVIRSSENSIPEDASYYGRVAWSLLGPFYILLTFAFMLPNFRPTYWDILQLSVVVGLNMSMSFVAYYSIRPTLTDTGFIRNEFSISAVILFTIANLLFFYYLLRRFYEVKNIKNTSEAFISLNEMIIIIILAVFTLLTILVSFRLRGVSNIFELNVPGYSFMVPFSFIFMFAAYHIYKDQSYPFIIPVNLHGIIIADRETGITILTKDYQTEIHAMDLLGNLFTVLNLSLQDTIKSTKTIEDIVFGDKVVHIASGSIVSTIVIVSKNSLITKSITKHLTKEFEKRYMDILKMDGPLNRNDFVDFDTVFDNVRKYLAL
ncbi:MAG: hypothetical protein FK732_02000 [Asgard group archaeon]|nr:hypothetical protein [Asgard group archaeon]